MINILEFLSYIAVINAVIGQYLNSNKDIRCFYLWMVSDIYLIVFNFYFKHYGVVLMYIVYFVLAIIGVKNWRQKSDINTDETTR